MSRPITNVSFASTVLLAVRRVPRGRVTTYQLLARFLGRAGGARAVGNALHANRQLGVIPCHRVVRSDGQLGGYRLGPAAKKKFLLGEGVAIDADNQVVGLASKLFYF